MPETRKHRVAARDALDEAIFAALGEPVRPATPGAAATPGAPSDGPADTGPADDHPDDSPAPGRGAPAASHTTTFVAPGTALGGFTFGAPRRDEDA